MDINQITTNHSNHHSNQKCSCWIGSNLSSPKSNKGNNWQFSTGFVCLHFILSWTLTNTWNEKWIWIKKYFFETMAQYIELRKNASIKQSISNILLPHRIVYLLTIITCYLLLTIYPATFQLLLHRCPQPAEAFICSVDVGTPDMR